MTSTSEPEPITNHYADGSVQSTGFLLAGEMHGEWRFIRKDGSVMRTGEFDRGTQIGTWRTYDRSGRLVSETTLPR
jgi:antitoxin component YwqK of YwqJK toxin-antitoxin module